jgi:uncharacterized protein (TIGR03086 family)
MNCLDQAMSVDFPALNRRAVLISQQVVASVTADDLGRPTPCAAWDLRALLAHMICQHRGFAAAARGNVDDLSVWQPLPLGADPVAAYAAAVDDVLDAFGADGVLARRMYLPEIRDGITVPAAMAMSFHFIDYVVHAWDVAVTIGRPVWFDEDILDAAMLVAGRVPDGAERTTPGAAFAPSLPTVSTDPLDRVLAMLGRSAGK